MKICLISEHATTNFGIGTHLQSLAAALVKRGHDVFIITNDHVNENPSRVRIYQHKHSRLRILPGKLEFLSKLLSFGTFITRIFRTERPAVVHSHSFYDFYLSKVAGLFLCIPVVNSHHSYVYTCPKNSRIRDGQLCPVVDERGCKACLPATLYYRKVLTRRLHFLLADAIVALNALEYDFLTRLTRRVYLISNWVDVCHFAPRDVQKEPKSIVFVGGFREVKRLDIMLRAFKELLSSDPEYKLIVVGDLDPTSSGLSGIDQAQYSKYIRALIEKEGIAHRIVFAGIVPKAQMPMVYSRGAVLVSTSMTEVNPISFLEALACNLPVVAFTNPLKLAIITTTQKKLATDIKAAIESGLDPKILQDVRERFSEHSIISKFEALYRHVIKDCAKTCSGEPS